jgi:hypothetical protein
LQGCEYIVLELGVVQSIFIHILGSWETKFGTVSGERTQCFMDKKSWVRSSQGEVFPMYEIRFLKFHQNFHDNNVKYSHA